MLRFFCPAWVIAVLSLAILSCTKPVVTGTEVELTATPNPAIVGQTVTFTATVSPSASTGSVTFTVDYVQQTVPLNAGVATWSTSTLTAGSHKVEAEYSGDAGHSISSAVPITQVVTLPTPGVTLSFSVATPVWGDSVTFTATVNPATTAGVTPSTPTGEVTFRVDGVAENTATLTNATATWTATGLTAGTHSVKAEYAGDAANSPSSVTKTLSVGQVDSTISVTGTPSSSGVGAPVTFTATVTPSGATGTVSCAVDGGSAAQVATLSGATGTWTDSALPVGTHTITCSYSGDQNVKASTADPLTQTVVLSSSTVTLTSSQSPSTYGTPVTITATVGPGATGTMVFNIDGQDQPAVPVSGSATVTIGTLAPGGHSIGATYSGDKTYAGGTASMIGQTVTQAPTTTVVQVHPSPSLFSDLVTVTATVTPTGTTGTITFSLDGVAMTPTPLNGTTAVWKTSTLAVGTRTIGAAYSGDTNFLPSTAANYPQTVQEMPTTLKLTSSLATSVWNQPVTFTAQLTPAGGESGSIVFSFDGVAQPPAAVDAAGTATIMTASLPVGAHTITAAYAGDGNYLPSAATATDGGAGGSITQTVGKAPTTVTVISSFNPIPFGQAVTFSATVSPPQATGTIVLVIDSVAQPLQIVSPGGNSVETSTLVAGVHIIGATYSGDANYSGSSSPALDQTVAPAVAGDGGVTCTQNPRSIPLQGGASSAAGGYLTISGSQLALTTVNPPFVEVVNTDGTGAQAVDLRSPGDGGVPATQAGGVAFAGTMLTWAQANNTAGSLVTSAPASLLPAPLAAPLNGPLDVLFDGTSILFTEDAVDAGAVGTVLPDGGGFARLVSGLRDAHGLTDDGAFVYWESTAIPGDGGPGTPQILRAAKGAPSSPAVVFANPTGLPLGGRLEVDANFVYFGDGVDAVMYVPKGGGAAHTLYSGQTGAGDVRLDGTMLYWYAGAVVHKGSLGGQDAGAPTSVVGTASAPDWVTDANCLYYMDKTGVFAVAK
jgi:hypothetical protein